ncbi:MAG: protein phosphatase CheZ, partial [Methylococcales bacterium]|nr:protein phosphatase CheZ [Methylococcales bacterium]
LVHDLEISMVGLIKISGRNSNESKESSEPELPGPVVPGLDDKEDGVAANQDDVDDLLSSMGF